MRFRDESLMNLPLDRNSPPTDRSHTAAGKVNGPKVAKFLSWRRSWDDSIGRLSTSMCCLVAPSCLIYRLRICFFGETIDGEEPGSVFNKVLSVLCPNLTDASIQLLESIGTLESDPDVSADSCLCVSAA